jgi:tol-pal system protein YbgF
VTRAVYRLALVVLFLSACAGAVKPEATVDAPRPAAPAAPAASPPPTATQSGEPARLTEQVSRVAGELSELQNAVAKLIASSRHQEDQLTFLRRRVEELEGQSRGRLPAAPSGFAPAPPAAPAAPVAAPAPLPPPAPLASATTTPAAELYREGATRLRAKELDAAILSFYDLIVTYPDHPLRESAQFLVADMFYSQKDLKGALAEFEALIVAVPRGEKVPDALLKIGLCHKGLGDTARARRSFERVVKEHPTSVAARQARLLLR